MSNENISRYFDATEFRDTREDLVYAVSMVSEPRIAIDCGCGAGADIEYLICNGFTVHGFDIEDESISRCRVRFNANDNVVLSRSSFVEFEYPQASLVVADASLYFCSISEFKKVWSNIDRCVLSGGIFCGLFLGKEDTMALSGKKPTVFWPAITAFDEPGVLVIFDNYELLRFKRHKSRGMTSLGTLHDWHIFQVVARKP